MVLYGLGRGPEYELREAEIMRSRTSASLASERSRSSGALKVSATASAEAAMWVPDTRSAIYVILF